MAKKSKTRHVAPNKNDGWTSKKGGAKRASKTFDTKKQAEKYSRNQSKKEGAELIIHKKDGRINRKDSHGNDPYPPEG